MPISICCGTCKSNFRVDEKHAGKRGKCPKCQAVVLVPLQNGLPQTESPEKTLANRSPDKPVEMTDILAAFQGEITPVRSTIVYRIGIAIVTLAMLLLPLVYIALIAGIGYAVVWHAVNNVEVMKNVRGIWGILLVYLGPIIAGCILLFFMIKPLFAPRRRAERIRTLEFGEEPLLFALVTRVARAVNAPEPKRINVDAQCNASASFGSLLGGDLELTVGLPLVAGMNIQQFAGVIAHELGHFSQGAGMRLSLVIRSINYWFARIVYERDDWDESLVRGCESNDRLSTVFYLARFCIWVSRGVLWLLMVVGHGISCFLLRQMEYDADRFETRLVGSAGFVSTSRRLLVLGVGTNSAHEVSLMSYLRNGKLPDDLSELVMGIVADVAPDKARELEHQVEKAKTAMFDTHPSDGDRIRSARAEKAPGIFHLEGPANQLFKDFRKTSKSCSADFFRNVFGKRIERDAMVPAMSLYKSLALTSLESL